MTTVGGDQFLQYTLMSKNVLSLEEQELYELSQLAGVVLDPSVFKIIMDLLKMNVAPQAILQVLRSISGQRPKKISSPEVSQRPNPGDADRRGKPRSRVPSNRKPEARRWPQAHNKNKSTEQTYNNTEPVYIRGVHNQCTTSVQNQLHNNVTLLWGEGKDDNSSVWDI